METNRIDANKKSTFLKQALCVLFAIFLVTASGVCTYSWGNTVDVETSKERLAELSAESAAANENAEDKEDIANPKPTTLSPQVQKKIEKANTPDSTPGEKATAAKPLSETEDTDTDEPQTISTASTPESEDDSTDKKAANADDNAKAEDNAEADGNENTPAIEAASESDDAADANDEFMVAAIGGKKYATLQEAIAAAKDGDTIKLLIDSVGYIKIENKKLTIDLNGHNIVKKDYSSAGTQSMVTINNADVTFKGNGKISGAAVQTTYVWIGTVNKVETIKLETTTSNTNQKYRVITAMNSNVTVDGPEILNYSDNYPLNEVTDKTYGGVIYVSNGDFTFKNGRISGGSASTSGIQYGAGVAVKNGNFTMTGGEISGTGLYRSGSGYGGAVYVAGTSANKKTVSITGGTMKNTFTASKNKAGQGGNLYTTYCDVTIGGDAKIQNGYASSGANVYVNYGSLAMNGGTVSGGKATAGGAGIYVNNAATTISGGSITGNTVTGTGATNNGGGLYSNNSQLTITGGTIDGNRTEGQYGGGIYATMPANSTLTLGDTITNNTAANAASKGGGVYIKSANNTKINVGDTTISGNTAAYGGGIALDAGTSATSVYTTTFNLSSDAKIYDNTATDAQNKIEGTGKNKTDEILLNYRTKVTCQLNGTNESGFNDREIIIGSTGYKFVEDKAIKGTGIANATSYYCYAENKVSRDDCVDAVILDPKGKTENYVSDHYVWNEAENKAELAANGAGLYTSLDDAIKAAKNSENKTIVVCSETEVRNADIKGEDVVVKRCEKHRDFPVLHLVGRVEISDITIDGCELDSGSAPLIKADNGANLTIKEGTAIKNARRSAVSGGFSGGAALEVAWGNGLSKLTIEGGTFDNNRLAKGSGGAIWAWHTAITINNGEFTNNYASYSGGALAPVYDGTLDVLGGTFDHNIAGSMGGAISTFAIYTNDGVEGNAAGHGVVSTVTGGKFTRNEAHESAYYAGGAIYNGRGCKLNLQNALITENYKNYATKGVDAAISNCSTGSIAIYKTQGAVVANNHKGTSINGINADIALDGSTGNTLAVVSDYAMDGSDCRWTGKNGEKVPKSYYQDTNKTFSIVSHPSEETLAYAKENASVVFTGNSATAQGTAIMNNGEMTIGANVKTVAVEKKWEGVEEGDNLPAVEVQLGKVKTDLLGNKTIEPMGTEFRDDAIQPLSDANDWKYLWTDLPAGEEWVVVEKEIGGYDSLSSEPTTTSSPDGAVTVVSYTITNVWNDETTQVSVEKTWKDNDNFYQIRPESIEVQLTSDLGATDINEDGKITEDEYVAIEGDSAKATLIPNDEGEWSWDFTRLPKYTKQGKEIQYSIKESPVGGYTSEVEGNYLEGFKITNGIDLGSIKIVKSIDGDIYKDADNNGTSTAVFHVVGEWNGLQIYDNYVGVNFSAIEQGKVAAQIDGLLVGATYTISEVNYDGSGYVETSSENTEITLAKGMSDEQITATFTNTSEGEHHNQGLVNRYTFTAGNPSVDRQAA